MKTEDFNKYMNELTNDFIDEWTKLVDDYAESNELGPNHKLTVFLYSHLGLERKFSQRVWAVGSKYMDAVVTMGKEIMKDAD